MKTLKSKMIAGVTALVLLFGVFFMVKAMEKNENAIKPKTEVQKTLEVQEWYYQLNSTAPGDINNPDNYALTKPSESAVCGTGTVVCSIQDEANPSDSNHPAMSHGNVTTNPTSYSRSVRQPFS